MSRTTFEYAWRAFIVPQKVNLSSCMYPQCRNHAMLGRFFNELPLYRSRVTSCAFYQISFHSRDLRFWLSRCPWRIFNSHEESLFLSDSHAIIGRLRYRGFSQNNKTRGLLRFLSYVEVFAWNGRLLCQQKTVHYANKEAAFSFRPIVFINSCIFFNYSF